MKEIAVFVKFGGPLLVPCRGYRGYQAPSGCFWHCAYCELVIIAVNLGVLSGFWRCPCGAEVVLLVDGQEVNMQAMNALDKSQEQPDETDTGNWNGLARRPVSDLLPNPQAPLTDDEFARQCGFALPNGEDEDDEK